MLIPLLQKVKDELLKMEETGIIEQIQEPTDWCAGIVIVPKKDGGVRICTETTVPSSPRQSSVLLRIGGTSAMSPAVPAIRKAMVLRSER